MLEALITSKTRIKLLLKFFLNPQTSAYLRSLSSEFGESSNAIRLELNRLEEAGMLKSENNGNKKVFCVNQKHPLFAEVNRIVHKYIGLDVILEKVIHRLGHLEAVYLTGDLALGKDSPVIDLVLIGELDRHYLTDLVTKAELLISRKIRYVIYGAEEFDAKVISEQKFLLVWGRHMAKVPGLNVNAT